MPFKGSQYILASPISAAQIVAPRDRPTPFADQFVSRLACDMHKNSPTAFILPPSFPCPEFCWNHFRFPSLFPQVFFCVSCFRDEIGSDDQQNLTANWEEQIVSNRELPTENKRRVSLPVRRGWRQRRLGSIAGGSPHACGVLPAMALSPRIVPRLLFPAFCLLAFVSLYKS